MTEPSRRPLVTFMPYGPNGASARVRVLEWLARTGVPAERHHYAGLADNRLQRVAKSPLRVLAAELRSRRMAHRLYERVLIQREVTPFSSGGIIERIASVSDLSVYDFDDALMWSLPKRTDTLWSKAENCVRAVRSVDRVIAGSDVLANWASEHNSDVRLIPTCVDPWAYAAKTDYTLDGPPRIVWLGSPSTEAYLAPIANALLKVHRLSDARLNVISAGGAPLGPLDEMVDRVGWRPGIERDLSQYDVAIAPLDDGPWERGKCAYKILQYGAAGLPCVVSPVGANEVAAERLGLEVARDERGWADALMGILSSGESDRARRGQQARAAVAREYSFARWEPDWLAAVGEAG